MLLHLPHSEGPNAEPRRRGPNLTEYGMTPFVIYRKDRVRFLAGGADLKSCRLSPEYSSERIIAPCCYAPVYLKFKGGHRLSLYGGLWPEGAMPPSTMRTMASGLPVGAVLRNDIPNAAIARCRHRFQASCPLSDATDAVRFRSAMTALPRPRRRTRDWIAEHARSLEVSDVASQRNGFADVDG